MTDQPLDTRLRRLRLGYMAQAFEAHNAESIKAKHSFLEFLEALVDGELAARENKGLMRRIEAARFPIVKTKLLDSSVPSAVRWCCVRRAWIL